MELLPIGGDGVCMKCKKVPDAAQVLSCKDCASPWHMLCLNPSLVPKPQQEEEEERQQGQWICPDCSLPDNVNATSQVASGNGRVGVAEESLVLKMLAIQADDTLTDEQKAKRRQELLMASNNTGFVTDQDEDEDASADARAKNAVNELQEILDDSLNCIICFNLCERPVSTPCGHNYCLKCFIRSTKEKRACPKCRKVIPLAMVNQPRINSSLVSLIRIAKSKRNSSSGNQGPSKVYVNIQNEMKPDKAYRTENAKRSGLSNASSGRIMVTIPIDHFGPISAEYDPIRNQGLLVGETWENRMDCRQWGAHFPHVAGISGQSEIGAQSVALSGGYDDDEDHGEWFLYTGSGGRDLSGNKRTNKNQSFDQKFEKYNEALRVSCKIGYPVRVVRSYKEKRSSYAPEEGIRYDGIYRIEKCWRKKGIQGFTVCRYLFVRCDNEPAPWTSDESGDKPRELPEIDELSEAVDVTIRKCAPAWDYKDGKWGWTRDPPPSRARETKQSNGAKKSKPAQAMKMKQKLLKEFGCGICHKVLTLPLNTPCDHKFCKGCLEGLFAGQTDMRERTAGGRSLRAQKIIKKCPSCQADITEFLANAQVNRQMEDIIRRLQEADKADIENGIGEEEMVKVNQSDNEREREDETKQSVNALEDMQVEDSDDCQMTNPNYEEMQVENSQDSDINSVSKKAAFEFAHIELQTGSTEKMEISSGKASLNTKTDLMDSQACSLSPENKTRVDSSSVTGASMQEELSKEICEPTSSNGTRKLLEHKGNNLSRNCGKPKRMEVDNLETSSCKRFKTRANASASDVAVSPKKTKKREIPAPTKVYATRKSLSLGSASKTGT